MSWWMAVFGGAAAGYAAWAIVQAGGDLSTPRPVVDTQLVEMQKRAPETRSEVQRRIDILMADQSSGGITPARIRQVLKDVLNAQELPK